MTDDERKAAELRGLLGFARGLGLDEAVGRGAPAASASDDARLAEVRKRMFVGA
ncbi:hypothetical protein Mpop_4256 [Methylorubrum populi BJ001]|uniref:Uncharacterized protein n=2 Tax=Methylorubrum populi TaxID=223967 RepID=B1ZDW9_METPB|nr:hypothetical protein Mpop_4256 [Methylorubrum populi BJ001]